MIIVFLLSNLLSNNNCKIDGLHIYTLQTGPLLSNDDQQRILESQEFDYDIGSLQKNQITSQNLFDDEAKVVDLILEEEIQFKEEISEREFNSFCKYLTSDFETGVETACNLRAAAPDDYSVEEKLDSANSTAYEENVSFAEDRNIEKRCISSSKTKRGRKYTQNERNVKCKCNLASRKPQVKKKSSKRISKHRKLQVTELNDGNSLNFYDSLGKFHKLKVIIIVRKSEVGNVLFQSLTV